MCSNEYVRGCAERCETGTCVVRELIGRGLTGGQVVRSMFIPCALHGIEASLLAKSSLLRFCSALLRVFGSRRQFFANVGDGCDPACCVVWFGFYMMRRYLALLVH